jgi:hypothetical protein
MRDERTNQDISEDYNFKFAGWLLTCALEATKEGARHSALRFIEATRKIIDQYKFIEGISKDSFLLGVKEELGKLSIERNQMKELGGQLQTILMKFAEEANKRD